MPSVLVKLTDDAIKPYYRPIEALVFLLADDNSDVTQPSRVTAAWLALDRHTDLVTLERMIEVARAGRRLRKIEQRRVKPKQ